MKDPRAAAPFSLLLTTRRVEREVKCCIQSTHDKKDEESVASLHNDHQHPVLIITVSGIHIHDIHQH